jgi:hypothetical protein
LEIFLICLEKVLFVLVASIAVRNTETNQNKPTKIFGVSRNKPKNNQNKLSAVCFRLNRKKIDCFEETLLSGSSPAQHIGLPTTKLAALGWGV